MRLMSAFPSSNARKCWAALLLLSLFFLPCLGETIRVTTWNMQENAGGKPALSLELTAGALKKADPDIILLQQVRDWGMCLQLADALKPAVYHVLVCSAFRDSRTGSNSQQQAAILSKQRGYFAWSEPWQLQEDTGAAGGFVFSAIQTARHRIGVFSVTFDDLRANSDKKQDLAKGKAQTDCRQQWIQEVQSFRNWTTNRIEGAIVAAAFDSSDGTRSGRPNLEEFAPPFLREPLANVRVEIEGNHFGAHLAANADTLPGILLVHSQMTCEVDLDADPRAMSFVSAGSPTITSPVALPASVAMQPFDGQNSSPSEQRF